jgi:hypothetical protein
MFHIFCCLADYSKEIWVCSLYSIWPFGIIFKYKMGYNCKHRNCFVVSYSLVSISTMLSSTIGKSSVLILKFSYSFKRNIEWSKLAAQMANKSILFLYKLMRTTLMVAIYFIITDIPKLDSALWQNIIADIWNINCYELQVIKFQKYIKHTVHIAFKYPLWVLSIGMKEECYFCCVCYIQNKITDEGAM